MQAPPDPIVVGVALALYKFNVSPLDRARALFEIFDGNCAELGHLVETLTTSEGNECTELAMPTAAVYVGQALERYGEEARERVRVNMAAWDGLVSP